ncbi:hypothetical protein HK100_011374 [Physocladia obscura]|uniref:Uncharacterized protein n=1 Tax=Physocladia obscura TaxID=109957 RepID=A0AAD5T3V9_9FUNG|nr:hypothetical protein HK100_011374 [Physocladia obscura]
MSNDSLPRSSSETELAFNDVANILLRPRSTRVSKDSRYSVKPPLPLTELHRISGKNSIVSTSSSFEKQRQQSDLYKNLAPYLLTVLTYDNVIHGSLVRKEMASGRSRSLGQRVVARLRHSIGAKLSSKTGSSENGKACTIAVTGKKMYVFDVPRSENGVFVAGPVTAEGEPVLLDSVGGSEVAMKRWSALLLKYEYPNAHLRQRADIVVDIIDVCIYAEKDALLQVIGREISGDSRVLFMQGTEIGEVERWLHIFERVANMKIAE